MQPMDPSAVAVLDALRKGGIPEWHTLLPVRAREVYQERVRLFGGTPSTVGAVHDTVADGPGGPLPLRIYQPVGGSQSAPVLLYLHGGGFTLGGLDSHDELCRRLCRTANAVVIGVEYRLAPEHPYPAALEDSRAALDWVVANIGNYGGDPDDLSVGGDSAGGTLTAALCLWARDHGGPKIRLQILLYAALQAEFETLSFYENGEGKFISTADCIWFWRNYLGPTRKRDPYAEPGSAAGLTGLPPALIITAGHDPVRDDGEIFAHRLMHAGNRVLLKRYEGMIHGFMAVPKELPDGRDAVELVARSINKGIG